MRKNGFYWGPGVYYGSLVFNGLNNERHRGLLADVLKNRGLDGPHTLHQSTNKIVACPFARPETAAVVTAYSTAICATIAAT